MVDPLKYLCEMRQDRGGMIQTSVSNTALYNAHCMIQTSVSNTALYNSHCMIQI